MAFWHEIEKAIGKPIEEADKWLREHGMPDIYVGAKSKDDGNSWNITTSNSDGSVFTGQTIGNAGKYKPAGYSRSAAATAKDIAQGGMTKDEVIEFNMKHPNETAQRSE